MKKISVASVPPIFQLVAKEDEDEGSVVCQGLTAKLHSRFGRFEDGSQVSECVKSFSLKLLPPKGKTVQRTNSAPQKSTTQQLLSPFEWPHFRISSTDTKVKKTTCTYHGKVNC